MSYSLKKILNYDFLYENYIIKNKSLKEISLDKKCSERIIKKYLRKFNIKKCNICGTISNLIIDNTGRIYSICHECSSLKSKEGTDKQKIKKGNLIQEGIERFLSGVIKSISYKFLYEQHYLLKKSITEMGKEFNLTNNSIIKFLKLNGLKEILRCTHCGTEKDLIIIDGNICKICKKCWKDSYKNRTFTIGKKPYKKQSINTNGIGIKAQFFFKDLEEFLKKHNIFCNEFIYGFFDLKERQLVKLEKGLTVININGRKSSKRLDCYIEINNRLINIEYDEIGHDILKDFQRENLLKKYHEKLEIYRIDEEFILKDKEYRLFIFNEILKTIKDIKYVSPFIKSRIADYTIDTIEENCYVL